MKRTFPLIVLMLGWFLQLSAQTGFYRVLVHGSVKDTDGRPVAGHPIRIIADSTSGFYYAAGTITGREGLFADTLSVPLTVRQGVLSIYTTDCKGTLLRQDIKFATWLDKAEAHFVICTSARNPCEARIAADSSGVLYALASGQEPFSYRWNTGETGTRIRPSASGTYCVTITDTSGCVASSCYFWPQNGEVRCKTYIERLGSTANGMTLLAARAAGVPPFTYAWSSGATGELDTVSRSGDYCVTVTDSRGCRSFSCEQVYVEPCGVTIAMSPDSTQLVAHAFGQGPFTYDWNNGAADQSIPLKEPGTYCVAVTDAAGCVSKTCFSWYPYRDSSSCKVYLKAEETADGLVLYAVSSGPGPYSYWWTTGESGPSILVTERGEYCVEAIDAAGCIAKACYPYHGRDSVDVGGRYWINGVVLDCDTLTEAKLYGWIYLLRQEADDSFRLLDSVVFGPGIYAARYGFFRVPPGRYLLKAVPYGGKPVYFPGVSNARQAVAINVPYDGDRLFPICIQAREQSDHGGKPGVFGGNSPKEIAPTLNLAPNPAGNTVRLRFGGEPDANSMLQLVSMTGQVLQSWRPQDQAMEVSLSGLPSGMYWFRLLNAGRVASARFIKE